MKLRKQNTNENIIKITKAAFSVNHQDEDLEIKMKLNLLKTIFGVQTPVASAILTLCYPNSFSVIDFRNWRQVFKTNSTKTNYSDTEYLGYLKIIRRTASDFGLSPQEIDIALWQRDIENI